MLVSVKSHRRSQRLPYPSRWKKIKYDLKILSRVPEEEKKQQSHPIDHLNLALTQPLATPSWHRQHITIPPADSPSRFGQFGGLFAPELQMDALLGLPALFHGSLSSDAFWNDFNACPLNRPSPLQLAQNLTKAAGGANIWLKREDLNPFASNQARNVIGQIIFAYHIGKREIVIECGFSGHGLVCASLCARMNMKCTIIMGASDIISQPDAVDKMKQLGATVVAAHSPGKDKGALRAATNEALRYSLSHLESAYHITTNTVGPHPIPTIMRTFQSLLGEEVKESFCKQKGRSKYRPDALISPSGPAALGMFAPFIDDKNVRLIAVEATDAAPLSHGSIGVMYGCKTLLLQDDDGQILPAHSVAPDLNFPCAGPELAHWKDIGRLETVTASSEEAVRGLRVLVEHEGIVPSLATGHAVLEALRIARELGNGRDVVLLVSG
ncbi:tryptophan synthase beta subunit-like PLP-dependent enzyme [Aspergillus karnatakaensis]|uniref:tryptophan synthase n=1 Tax=Aspergillus karnatakaensis TaxID=1810916 RepID=UPI003CCDE893